jgi:predicted DNA-binding transcriptional regulator YafY
MAAADKFERQMNLLAALLDAPRPISAEQIQERVAGYSADKDAFRRTFERDKDELRELGVPVQVATIPATFPEQQGYLVDRSVYELPELELEADEIAALRLALQAVRVGDPSAHESESSAALWRLGGLAGGTAVAVDDEIAAIPADHRQTQLFHAVLERRVCRFEYPSSGGVTERVVEPWRVGYERGHWYLTGFDQDRSDQRQFRLDRMSEKIVLGEPDGFSDSAPLPEGSTYRPWDDGSADQVLAVVCVDADQAPWAAEMLGEHTVVGVDGNGGTIFNVPITSWPAFRSFLLSFLDHAELLEPPELRADLIEWLESTAAGDRS